MKKIVGIIAAVAMATSVFAADVSAKVEILGRIFNYNASSKQAGLFAVTEGLRSWNPVFSLAVSGDKAGASVKFYDNDLNVTPQGVRNLETVNYNIWFQPADILKINVGQWSTNLNQEKIDWSHTETGIDDVGVAFNIASNGFTFDAFFVTKWSNANWHNEGVSYGSDGAKYWFTKTDDNDAVIGQTYLKVGYGADFGTINAMLDATNSFKTLKFGAGYANTFGSVNMFVNAIAAIDTSKDDAFGKFRGEAFVSTNIDAFGISAFIAGEYVGKTNVGFSGWRIGDISTPEKAAVGASLKFTYGINGYTPYLYIKDVNFLADNFSMEVKPGVTFNVGTCAFDIAVDMTLQEKVVIDVPVGMTVSF